MRKKLIFRSKERNTYTFDVVVRIIGREEKQIMNGVIINLQTKRYFINDIAEVSLRSSFEDEIKKRLEQKETWHKETENSTSEASIEEILKIQKEKQEENRKNMDYVKSESKKRLIEELFEFAKEIAKIYEE